MELRYKIIPAVPADFDEIQPGATMIMRRRLRDAGNDLGTLWHISEATNDEFVIAPLDARVDREEFRLRRAEILKHFTMRPDHSLDIVNPIDLDAIVAELQLC